MIYLYISPSCQSCRKALKWFQDNDIEHVVINILQDKLTSEDIFRMLKNSFNGFDDIISKRSKPYLESNLDIDNMRTSELVNFIIKNPTILRRPIIVAPSNMEVGYNPDDIDAFLPREKRFSNIFLCKDCPKLKGEQCDHENESILLSRNGASKS